ncbi:MAG: hypothetical protein HYZ75_13215 [Elusimicrobia bacterium]|nr:hypothetical protein [Elusimicrobiota bacterium]
MRKGKQARKALANFKETSAEDMADLFVVLMVDGQPFVRSTDMLLRDTWREFWDQASEWAFVEIQWHCDDNSLGGDDKARIVKSIVPDLYHIDLDTAALTPVDDSVYARARACREKSGRQFAFLSQGMDQKLIAAGLARRIEEVHGRRPEKGFVWNARPKKG